MDQAELVRMIGDLLTELDELLVDPDLDNQSSDWQTVYALRKHLDDQQRDLVKATIDANDVNFRAQAGLIDKANAQLEKVADEIAKIDQVIDTISQVCASLDSILKAT